MPEPDVGHLVEISRRVNGQPFFASRRFKTQDAANECDARVQLHMTRAGEMTLDVWVVLMDILFSFQHHKESA